MVYRFGPFVFDRERGLLDDGARVPLEPQVSDLLGYLLENRGRIVTKDELHERIWNGRIVSEAALSTRVRAVRRALGDDRDQQKYIRTHPKRGFEFVAAVEEFPPGDSSPGAHRWLSGRTRRRFVAAIAALVLLLAALPFGWSRFGHWGNDAATMPPLSIVVLPFSNLSGESSQDYFVDAMTEDLITDLSRIRDAFVIARRTSFTYKHRDADIKSIAAELGVRYVLEGSVRRDRNLVRINVRLIDGQTESHIWSNKFDREFSDAFSVQSEITGRIASALKAELRVAEDRRGGGLESMEAWDYALRGNVLLFNPKGASDFIEAKRLLERAIQLDPNVASAWSGLAFVHFVASQVRLPGITEPNSALLALETAKRAVAIDPRDAEGHWIIGVGYALNGQADRGVSACQTAMLLNPNNDCAYVCAGLTSMALGKPEMAIPYFEKSLRLNPRFRPFTKYKYMAIASIQSGQENLAVEFINKAIAAAPSDAEAHFVLASALAHLDRMQEARAVLATYVDLVGDHQSTVSSLRARYAWMGPDFERVLDGLSLTGLPET
jgi:TolB-like protein/DNA-binding winged helix-turn-helix (wHTH) protein/Flp pilus assembly protein TadD